MTDSQVITEADAKPATTPIITIDGPSGAGKGTICRLVANACGFALLDSGSLYRLTALSAMTHGIDLNDAAKVAELASSLPVEFITDDTQTRIFLNGVNVSADIRREDVGMGASIVAALEPVRDALLDRQKAFKAGSGLVADGRDMGTVIFPDADLKIFLTASAQERASRRYKQLQQSGSAEANTADFDAILRDVKDRDTRDSSRATSPLKPAQDAVLLDSTGLSIVEVFDLVMINVRERNLLLAMPT